MFRARLSRVARGGSIACRKQEVAVNDLPSDLSLLVRRLPDVGDAQIGGG
jgi:hypothetical protein